METTEPKNKVCYRCRNFSGYYTKGLSRFERTGLGYCRERKEIADNQGSCDCWRSSFTKLRSAKKTSMRVLSEMLPNITAIRQILEEEQEDERKLHE